MIALTPVAPARRRNERRDEDQKHAEAEDEPGGANIDSQPERRFGKHLHRQRGETAEKSDPDQIIRRHCGISLQQTALICPRAG